jgi:hypothetical protein
MGKMEKETESLIGYYSRYVIAFVWSLPLGAAVVAVLVIGLVLLMLAAMIF